ncbi:hypothetical protein B0H19DRAFT_1255176 [Mycena capillaripes]|nr:hypothetical protein B0H19DRAFT_1255176 [Mycena capillaripes]
MFSKIFTIGLAALTFVGAAPATGFHQPMAISRSGNVQSVGSGAAAYSLQPGTYQILDVPSNSQLRCLKYGTPVFVSEGEFPGHFGEWKVEAAAAGAFTISNVGLDRPVHADYDGSIISGNRTSTPFAIQSTGDNKFVIKSVKETLVWTLKTPGQVQLLPERGKQAQRWKFVKIHS